MQFSKDTINSNGLNKKTTQLLLLNFCLCGHIHVVPPTKAKCFKRKHHMFDISNNILYLSTCLVSS